MIDKKTNPNVNEIGRKAGFKTKFRRIAAVLVSCAPAAMAFHANAESAEPPAAPPAAEQPQPPQPPQPPQAGAGEAQQAQQQLMQLEAQIGAVQEQAMQDEQIQRQVNDFQESVQEHMISNQPALEDLIGRQQAIEAEVSDDPGLAQPPEERSDELNAKIQEHQEISMQVSQAEQQALQAPEVAAEREALEEKILSAMEQIEPGIQEMLEEYQQLLAAVQAPGQP